MWYEYYERSRPRRAKGGIKAQNKRGEFGKSWWAKRWIAVLESFNLGARLSRGRSYARNGQVLSIDVDKGLVTASVQGSRPRPYGVEISVKELPAADWKKVTKALSEQAIFSAKLLAGEMPNEVEEIFTKLGLSLFPGRKQDLETDCSCPDYSNPCKHIAAVYYLLGEEFDRDPFLIFKLRGMGRAELLAALGGAARAGKAKAAEARHAPEPLPAAPAEFWSGKPLPADFFGEVQPASAHAALPRRLGSFPFWRGEELFLDALTPIYEQAGRRGLEVFEGVSGDDPAAG